MCPEHVRSFYKSRITHRRPRREMGHRLIPSQQGAPSSNCAKRSHPKPPETQVQPSREASTATRTGPGTRSGSHQTWAAPAQGRVVPMLGGQPWGQPPEHTPTEQAGPAGRGGGATPEGPVWGRPSGTLCAGTWPPSAPEPSPATGAASSRGLSTSDFLLLPFYPLT